MTRLDDAEAECADDNVKKTKKRLQQAGTALTQYVHRLAGHTAKKRLGDVRKDYQQAGQAIVPDLKTLRGQVQCPPA
jgi:hypothetical protein